MKIITPFTNYRSDKQSPGTFGQHRADLQNVRRAEPIRMPRGVKRRSSDHHRPHCLIIELLEEDKMPPLKQDFEPAGILLAC